MDGGDALWEVGWSRFRVSETSSLDACLSWVGKAVGPVDLELRPDLGAWQTDLRVRGIQMTVRTQEAAWGDGVPVRRKNKGQIPRTVCEQMAWVSIPVLFLTCRDTWVNSSTSPSLSLLICNKENPVASTASRGVIIKWSSARGALVLEPGTGGLLLYCSLPLDLMCPV